MRIERKELIRRWKDNKRERDECELREKEWSNRERVRMRTGRENKINEIARVEEGKGERIRTIKEEKIGQRQ